MICKPLLPRVDSCKVFPNERSPKKGENSTIPERDPSTATSSTPTPNPDTLLISSQDMYEDIGLERVDMQEILGEIYQVIADLYEFSVVLTQSTGLSRLRQKAYRIVNEGEIDQRTLNVYNLPWERKVGQRYNEEDEIVFRPMIVIKQIISDHDLEILLEHTRKVREAERKLREAERTADSLLNPDRVEKLGSEKDEPQIKNRSRRSSPKGLLAEKEMNVDPEMPSVEEMRRPRRSLRSRRFAKVKERERDSLSSSD